MSETKFNLLGGTEENDSGMWQAGIRLETPDGKVTDLSSGFVYTTEALAEESLQFNLDRILKEFRKDDVEVLKRNDLEFQ